MNNFGLRHRIQHANLYVKEGLPEQVIPNVASNINADLLIIGSNWIHLNIFYTISEYINQHHVVGWLS